MVRTGRIIAGALIVIGALIVADIGVTLLWKEPLTSLYAAHQQDGARSQLGDLERQFPSPSERRVISHHADKIRQARRLAQLFAKHVKEGQAIGQISIPAIGLNIVTIEGTGEGDLEKGPGHYPSTPFPGQPGTVAIAGHRTTFLAPFRNIGSLTSGDAIRLHMPYGRFTYRVQRTKVVDPHDFRILRPQGYQRLVLSACHPLYSATQRIIVFARLHHVTFPKLQKGGNNVRSL